METKVSVKLCSWDDWHLGASHQAFYSVDFGPDLTELHSHYTCSELKIGFGLFYISVWLERQ